MFFGLKTFFLGCLVFGAVADVPKQVTLFETWQRTVGIDPNAPLHCSQATWSPLTWTHWARWIDACASSPVPNYVHHLDARCQTMPPLTDNTCATSRYPIPALKSHRMQVERLVVAAKCGPGHYIPAMVTALNTPCSVLACTAPGLEDHDGNPLTPCRLNTSKLLMDI